MKGVFSVCVWGGFPWVLQFQPTLQKHACVCGEGHPTGQDWRPAQGALRTRP